MYVVSQGALLRGALAGSLIRLHALAELAHADGADERDARLREQVLPPSFVRDQRVDATYALRYLGGQIISTYTILI